MKKISVIFVIVALIIACTNISFAISIKDIKGSWKDIANTYGTDRFSNCANTEKTDSFDNVQNFFDRTNELWEMGTILNKGSKDVDKMSAEEVKLYYQCLNKYINNKAWKQNDNELASVVTNETELQRKGTEVPKKNGQTLSYYLKQNYRDGSSLPALKSDLIDTLEKVKKRTDALTKDQIDEIDKKQDEIDEGLKQDVDERNEEIGQLRSSNRSKRSRAR